MTVVCRCAGAALGSRSLEFMLNSVTRGTLQV